ncbi:hypothetical protein B0T22DRAFT_300234 [Podospora appendiculata]|uniref:Ankyrin n=1 Tax=Podospora appendiculata TaxID=314037 RepID=A0AAE1C7K8_9PEZI|nr:hypothetical protein B0T22DRAFT_300234 [Podospora appendiculata]
MVKLLLSRGADSCAVTSQGKTPLHYACGWWFRVDCPSETRNECVRALIQAGTNVTSEDDHGRTPIDMVNEQDFVLLGILGSAIHTTRD